MDPSTYSSEEASAKDPKAHDVNPPTKKRFDICGANSIAGTTRWQPTTTLCFDPS